jgi:large subunit ribosomal protein L19
MEKVRQVTKSQLKNDIDVRVGDTVRVHQRIKEGEKERIQIFEGLVIARKHGSGINGTFTVRKVTSGVGVEKIFPIHMPMIEKIEIVKSGRVRRSKIYYIRDAKGRRGRLKEIKRNEKESVLEKELKEDKKDIEKVEETEEVEGDIKEEKKETKEEKIEEIEKK